MTYKQTTPNPIPTAHDALANQEDWWSDDASIKYTEAQINSHNLIKPTAIEEGGALIHPASDNLSTAMERD